MIGILTALLTMFITSALVEADLSASIKGDWEDTYLKSGILVYDTSGGYEESLSLSRTLLTSSRTRILVRIPMKEYYNAEFMSDGTVAFKIKTPPKKEITVNMYLLTQADYDWKSAEDSTLGSAAAGYACWALKKRDSDVRGGKLGYYDDRAEDGTAWSGGYVLGEAGEGSFEKEPFASVMVTPDDTELAFNIPKSILADWASGKNYGFLMRFEEETGTANSVVLYSANSGENKPELNFTYTNKEFNITNLSVKNSDGREVYKLYPGIEGLDISVTVENKMFDTKYPRLFCAVYSSDGVLKLACASSEYTLEHGMTVTLDESFAKEQLKKISENDILKLMIWDGEKLTPLSKSSVIDKTLPNIKISDFSAVSASNANMSKIGIAYGRMDFGWGTVEPEKGKFDENVLKSWGDKILQLKSEGVTLLPILDYTAPWAVTQEAYTYNYNQSGTIVVTRGPLENDNGVYRRDIMTVNNGVATVRENVQVDVTKEPFADVEDWKNYVEKIVSTYSAEPYNLEYFQIWNEAHPESGFFNGDMVWYMENIHKSAAEIIHKYGCKVVYGGWPCCGNVSWFTSLLTKTNAWHTVDVFDIHYLGIGDVNYIYESALKNGVISPSVWQTEIGFTGNTAFVADTYPLFLNEALKRRSEKENQFRYYYFTYWSPDNKDAYGYGACLFAGNNLTGHGKAMKTFISLLDGDNIQRYTNASISDNSSVITGFEVDEKKVVTHLKTSDLTNLQGKAVYYEGISDVKSVKIIDQYGDTELNAEWNDVGDFKGYVKIPDDYQYNSFYITVEADRIIPPENNIRDFEHGSNNDGRSLVAGGRWSYLDDDFTPLQKGTGFGSFSVNEWAIDNYNKTEHAWCLDNSGRIFTDSRPVYYNYTVDREQAGKSLNVSGMVNGAGTDKILVICKSSDKSEYMVDGTPELIYSLNVSGTEEFSINIPAESVEYGNDISIGICSKSNDTWHIPAVVDVNIVTF